jgi:hypothetical protein
MTQLDEAEERFRQLDRELAKAMVEGADPDTTARLKAEWRESISSLQRTWTAAREAERNTGARL